MLLCEIESINYLKKNNQLFTDVSALWKKNIKYHGDKPVNEGKLGNLEIQSITFTLSGFQKCMTFMLFDPARNKYVAGIDLVGFGRNARSWQVDKIGVVASYQGRNLSVKLYEWLIKEKNLILLTGMSQTAGGRSIWERLANTPGIFIFGYDVSRKQSFQVDQKDLFSEDVYTEELAQEIAELNKEQDDLFGDQPTPEAARKESRKKWDALQKEIDRLNKEIWHIGDYIRLVAIKSQK